jgi:hypothetical protein
LLLTERELFVVDGLAAEALPVTDRDLFDIEGLADRELLSVVRPGRELDRTWALDKLEADGRFKFASPDRFPDVRVDLLVPGRCVLADEVCSLDALSSLRANAMFSEPRLGRVKAGRLCCLLRIL